MYKIIASILVVLAVLGAFLLTDQTSSSSNSVSSSDESNQGIKLN